MEEERFHAAHGAAWFRRLAAADGSRSALETAVASAAESLLRWFGPDSDRARMMVDEQVMDAAGSALRARFVERVAPLLEQVGLADSYGAEPAFDAYDETRRRSTDTAPDAAVIEKVRGDRNRPFLME